MLLSQNQEIFSLFFFFLHFQNLNKICDTFKQKMSLTVICFWNCRQQKAGLPKCLKIPMSEYLSTVNTLRCPKDCFNLHGNIFLIFLIALKRNQPQKFCFSGIWNLVTFCYPIDTRWYVFPLRKSKRLTKPIQMLLFQNQKIFSEISSPLPKST